MYETPQFLAGRLQEERERVVNFFNSLTPDQWQRPVYPEVSTWTIHELLAHFVSAEKGRIELIEDVSSGGNGAEPGFDIDAYNEKEVKVLSICSEVELMEQFSAERSKLIKLVMELNSDDLERTGNDPFLGITKLNEMIKLTYRHLQTHLREVKRYF